MLDEAKRRFGGWSDIFRDFILSLSKAKHVNNILDNGSDYLKILMLELRLQLTYLSKNKIKNVSK